jgi:hypothetical protein
MIQLKKVAIALMYLALAGGFASTQLQGQTQAHKNPSSAATPPHITATANQFVGTWKKIAKDGGQMLTDVLIIERTGDGTLRVREKEVMDNTEFRSVVYSNGTIKGTLYMAVDSEWTTPFAIKMSGKDTIKYSDQRGEEFFVKQN